MSIEALTPPEEIVRYIAEQIKRRRDALIYNLQAIGEAAVKKARTASEHKSPYTDQTGNLRSSIGYVLVVDGEIVTMSSFPKADKGTDGVTGGNEGKAFAEEAARNFPQGITLLVVAGMNYASYVADNGKDVLASGQLEAEKLARQLVKDLNLK